MRGRADYLPTSTQNSVAGSLTGLEPVISSTTRLLVLGSFPGGASLAAGQYYAHPRNGFWPVVGAIFGLTLENITTASYQNRCAWLQNWRIGLWDVYAHCERQGSLDSAIRNAVLNDFASLKHRCPQLAAVAHNGAESFRHARAVQAVLGVPAHRLPSTSPANASWSFERKRDAWRECFATYGLVA